MRTKLILCGALIGVMVLLAAPSVQSGPPADKVPPKSAEVNESTYVIGPEDVLFIHIWKEESLSRAVPVRQDGKISLPMIDDIQAEGMTPLQLKEVLKNKLKNYIDNPAVSVIVVEANSYRVYVAGQVRNPGMFRLRSETSLLQIIPMAGGFTEWADQKKIMIIRKENGKERRIVANYKKIVDGASGNSDILLKSGDTVFVP